MACNDAVESLKHKTLNMGIVLTCGTNETRWLHTLRQLHELCKLCYCAWILFGFVVCTSCVCLEPPNLLMNMVRKRLKGLPEYASRNIWLASLKVWNRSTPFPRCSELIFLSTLPGGHHIKMQNRLQRQSGVSGWQVSIIWALAMGAWTHSRWRTWPLRLSPRCTTSSTSP